MSKEKDYLPYELALHNLTVALDTMMTGLNNYRKKPNASQYAIEKQENSIIAIYQFIESTKHQLGGHQYGYNRIYSAAIFWKQTTFNSWKENENWKEMYKASTQRNIELQNELLSLTNTQDGKIKKKDIRRSSEIG